MQGPFLHAVIAQKHRRNAFSEIQPSAIYYQQYSDPTYGQDSNSAFTVTYDAAHTTAFVNIAVKSNYRGKLTGIECGNISSTGVTEFIKDEAQLSLNGITAQNFLSIHGGLQGKMHLCTADNNNDIQNTPPARNGSIFYIEVTGSVENVATINVNEMSGTPVDPSTNNMGVSGMIAFDYHY